MLSECCWLSVAVCSAGGEVCGEFFLSVTAGGVSERRGARGFRVKRLQPGSATSPLGWPYYRITICFQDLNLNYVFPDSRKPVLKRNQVASTVEKCPARLPIGRSLLRFFEVRIERFLVYRHNLLVLPVSSNGLAP